MKIGFSFYMETENWIGKPWLVGSYQKAKVVTESTNSYSVKFHGKRISSSTTETEKFRTEAAWCWNLFQK
jgi:hypothetical protein